MRRFVLAISIIAAAPLGVFAQPATGLKAPPGFEVVEFADQKLANDIYCMTVDPKGRVIVSGRGYIRILVDDDGDGKADRALEFAKAPKDGAMGLLWEGDTLYFTGDGGLRRFRSKNGNQADGPSELIRAMKTGGEHSSHAIQRGPDGWLYVLTGNNAGINKSYAELPTSPIKEPTAGCVLRLHPTSNKCEIVAHGYRNPYGFDFNLNGDLFTFDSDNERCVSLPWYEPTRFYHVIEGRHYGWLNPQHAAFWRRPPYFCDVVAPVATLGRGSPTGVACYRHNQFPPEYHGGFFLGDWTFGKIHFASLERKGASYTAKTRVFLESQGDNGFAPTACAVDPKTGDLYVSIGGRGTRGAVYRIRHTERFKKLGRELMPLAMTRRPLEWDEATKKDFEAKSHSESASDYLWALQMARRQRNLSLAVEAWRNENRFEDRNVVRAHADLMDEYLRILPPAGYPAAMVLAKKRLSEVVYLPHWANVSAGLGLLLHDRLIALDRGLFILDSSKLPEEQVEGVRLVQMGLGDIGSRKSIGTIWEGYSPRLEIKGATAGTKLARLFPNGNRELDYELARTLGMLAYADADLRSRVLAKCNADSSPIDDIHYLACYARLAGKRAETEAKLVAAALLDLDRKIAGRKLNRDSNWALRVRELYVGLVEKDAALHPAMVEHRDFGRADHALFANVDGFPKERAARIFLKRWQMDKDFALTGDIVQLFATLPIDDVLPTVRKRWGDTGQDAAFLPLLAKMPVASDRGKFIDGLNSPQTAVLLACLDGLEKLAAKSDAEEAFGLIRALHRAQADARQPAPYGARLAKRLEKTTGQAFGLDSKRWIAWLEKTHPEFGKRLANPDGVDVAKWDKRLAQIDWNAGNAERGKAVFAKASCVHCHSGTQALGPDLAGVTNRFSRPDLITAILQPSKDVPARYQTVIVETKAGKTHQGIVIYDAVDSLLLQTGAATTVRVDGADIASRRVAAQSLMPAGLLDPLVDRDIADLFAYLRSLGKQ